MMRDVKVHLAFSAIMCKQIAATLNGKEIEFEHTALPFCVHDLFTLHEFLCHVILQLASLATKSNLRWAFKHQNWNEAMPLPSTRSSEARNVHIQAFLLPSKLMQIVWSTFACNGVGPVENYLKAAVTYAKDTVTHFNHILLSIPPNVRKFEQLVDDPDVTPGTMHCLFGRRPTFPINSMPIRAVCEPVPWGPLNRYPRIHFKSLRVIAI